jgi:type I restriction enzyme M protein
MSDNAAQIVQRLGNYCNILRDDGVTFGQYVTQLTYLLFLKMDDELAKPPYNRKSDIPVEYNWQTLLSKDGDELEVHYRHVLENLGKQKGIIGIIFRKSQNEIRDPAKLKRLISDLIDSEAWVSLDVDIKGAAYEGLLEADAQDRKSGAGQYFTPRALIRGIVAVVRPKPNQTICDPACGTGGFLLAAHEHIANPNNYNLDKDQKKHLKFEAFSGIDIADDVARLCAMNMYLNGIGGGESPITVKDSLAEHPGKYFDMVLTNPPFGKKSSVAVMNGDGETKRESMVVIRDDFWASTSNKQLNFIQHVCSTLNMNGRAAMVVPDNVLFEGGAGETIRRKLLHNCDVHTLLRLPTGIFYRPGVKANVLFFDRKPARERPWTDTLWIYDFRTNKHFTLKKNPLTLGDLDDFISCFNPENRYERAESERFKAFKYEDLIKRDKVNLDIFWLKDESLEDSTNLPAPEVIAREIADDLQAALEQFESIVEDL